MYIRTRVCVYVHVFLRVAGKDLSQIYPSQISEVCMYVIYSYVYNTRAYISCVYRYIYIHTHVFVYVHAFLRVAGKDLLQAYLSDISKVCMYIFHSCMYNTQIRILF